MNRLFLFLLCAVVLGMTACTNRERVDWLIPSNQVFDGGPGKDGIPSIDTPQFSDIDEIDFLRSNDLVVGIVEGDEARAYPPPCFGLARDRE